MSAGVTTSLPARWRLLGDKQTIPFGGAVVGGLVDGIVGGLVGHYAGEKVGDGTNSLIDDRMNNG